jgi:acyl-coenzyme A synthetase/AMP-(fatty) acid ligase
VVATVVLRGEASATGDALREHCAARLARFKVPKEIGFVDALPRTASGKLLRRELSSL